MSQEALNVYNFTGGVRPGRITPKRSVPNTIPRPDYADHPEGRSGIEEADFKQRIVQYDAETIAKCRKVCKLAREVLNLGIQAAKVGAMTDEIDRVVHEATVERGMYPSPLGYYGFPKSLCTSVNEIICHGIPDSRELQDGDIVNIDVSCYLDGVHADLNETVFIGRPAPETVRLVHCAYECMMNAIAIVKPGVFYREVGNVITERATRSNCSVVRTYCGHGVADKFHCAPTIPHYANNKGVGTMATGHIFTIEPMINQGDWQDVTWPDKWTSATIDGKWSAQFEHTMVVVPGGCEILTLDPEGPWYQRQLKELGIPLPTD
jgi:methionyl aminopeptidase